MIMADLLLIENLLSNCSKFIFTNMNNSRISFLKLYNWALKQSVSFLRNDYFNSLVVFTDCLVRIISFMNHYGLVQVMNI